MGDDADRAGDALRALLESDETASATHPEWQERRLTQLRASVARMRDPAYDLFSFHDDMLVCFPELRLYVSAAAAGGAVGGDSGDSGANNGGAAGEQEYQRTIGALFAIYWMMRIDVAGDEGPALGGQCGLCFGADTAGRPPSASAIGVSI